MASRPMPPAIHRHCEQIEMGYVPLVDCAPLVVAEARGFFQKRGLQVRLRREAGWATIRDKVIYGELDAAPALAGMVLTATLGVGGRPAIPCLTALILSLNGNAITLSKRLYDHGVTDGPSLRHHLQKRSDRQPVTLGTVFAGGAHTWLLHRWLTDHGIDPRQDVRIAVVPPPQMANSLRAGHIDGYCAGEPWNSLAVESGVGVVVATSADLAHRHLEKVLMVRATFAEFRAAEHEALVAALHEACQFCQAPENRAEVCALLASPDVLDLPADIIGRSLQGPFRRQQQHDSPEGALVIFGAGNTNKPDRDKYLEVCEQLRFTRVIDRSQEAATEGCFRPDLYDAALQRPSQRDISAA